MNGLIRFKILLQIMGVSTLGLIIFSSYCFGIYSLIDECIKELSSFLDIAKWQNMGRI